MSDSLSAENLKQWLRHEHDTEADGDDVEVPSELTPAAVLVPLVLRDSGITVLLTQRTAHLHNHAGQISFPGGRVDLEDADHVAAALREAEEEVGLTASQIEIVATLATYRTGTGFRIEPVVGLVTPPLNLKLDDFEVADVFEVPLEFLLDENNWRRESKEFNGRLRHFWAMPWRDRYIWGATAGMIVNLKHRLDAATKGTPRN
jgi:8-oxo-dGTP pyrophosphatase MutT (NUDIX family)